MGIDINDNSDFDTLWPELMLLMPEANTIPDFAYDLSFTPRLLVAPDHIISDHNNGTRWWEKIRNTTSFEHFKAGNF